MTATGDLALEQRLCDRADGVVPGVVAQALRAVWPGSPSIARARSCRAGDAAEHYLVLPRLTEPRWLVPIRTPVPVAVLAAPGSSTAVRATLRGVSILLRSGLGRRSPLPKVRVETSAGPTLVDLLGDVFGEDDLTVALRLGHWRDARAVVLRLFSPTGETLGFAKLSLGPAGRTSVQAELAGLVKAESLGLASIEVPSVRHYGPWLGQRLLVTSPLVGTSGSRSGPGAPLPAMAELAAARGARVGPLAASGWHASVQRRLDRVTAPEIRARLARALVLCAGRGGPAEPRLPLGWWHGDWTPWNMARRAGRVLLWDWEHVAQDVPIGFDLAHYLAQRTRVGVGTSARAERRWRCEAAALLDSELRLDVRQRDLLLAAYLLEVNLRYVLDRQASSQESEPRDGWGLELLEHEADRLREAVSR